MNCNRFYEIISAFVDSEATALEQHALQEHIKSCAKCKTELDSQYDLKELFGEYQRDSKRIDISAKVMKRIGFIENNPEDNPALYSGKDHSHFQWAAVAFMLILTAAVVFSAHRINSANTVKDPDIAYANYIYEHVSDEINDTLNR